LAAERSPSARGATIWRVMDAATTAALIGAGVGSAASLVAQVLSHGLSVNRDRRNQRRAQLYDAIVAAASALYGPAQRVKVDPDEPPPKPGTVGALFPVSPELRELQRGIAQSTLNLQVHFGHGHPLIESYSAAAQQCLLARHALDEQIEHGDTVIDKIPELAKALVETQAARDKWMREARAVVERI
jgi:hypothetical protein